MNLRPDMTPQQTQARLGLTSRTTFWRSIWKGVDAGVVKVISHGPRCIRFDADSVEAWRKQLMAGSVADLRRLADGRRRRRA